jgi:hypothetical protein
VPHLRPHTTCSAASQQQVSMQYSPTLCAPHSRCTDCRCTVVLLNEVQQLDLLDPKCPRQASTRPYSLEVALQLSLHLVLR